MGRMGACTTSGADRGGAVWVREIRDGVHGVVRQRGAEESAEGGESKKTHGTGSARARAGPRSSRCRTGVGRLVCCATVDDVMSVARSLQSDAGCDT